MPVRCRIDLSPWTVRATFVASTLLVSGCFGGAAVLVYELRRNRTASEAEPFLITEVNPPPGGEQVEPQSALSVVLSRPVQAASVVNGTLVVEGEFGPISGALEVAGDEVRFVPTDRLLLGATYRATVADLRAESDGRSLADPFSWNFTVREGLFSEPEALENGFGPLQLARSSSRSAVVLHGGGILASADRSQFYAASTFTWDVGFDAAQILFSAGTLAEGAVLTADGDGFAQAFSIPDLDGGPLLSQWRSASDALWSVPEVVGFACGTGNGLAATLHLGGESTVCWSRSPGCELAGLTSGLFATHGDQSGFEAEQILSDVCGCAGAAPVLAGNAAGSAMVLWIETGTLFYRYYDAALDAWSSDTFLDSTGSKIHDVAVAMDDAGNCVAVWDDFDDLQFLSAYFDAEEQEWRISPPIPGGRACTKLDVELTLKDSSRGFMAVACKAGDVELKTLTPFVFADPPVFEGVLVLETSLRHTEAPRVVFDERGQGLVIWHSVNSGSGAHEILVRRSRIEALLDPVVLYSTPLEIVSVQAVPGPDSRFLLTWSESFEDGGGDTRLAGYAIRFE